MATRERTGDTFVSMSGTTYLTVTRQRGAGWVTRVDRLAERTHVVSEPLGSRVEAQRGPSGPWQDLTRPARLHRLGDRAR